MLLPMSKNLHSQIQLQAALVIRGLGIRGFDYSLRKNHE